MSKKTTMRQIFYDYLEKKRPYSYSSIMAITKSDITNSSWTDVELDSPIDLNEELKNKKPLFFWSHDHVFSPHFFENNSDPHFLYHQRNHRYDSKGRTLREIVQEALAHNNETLEDIEHMEFNSNDLDTVYHDGLINSCERVDELLYTKNYVYYDCKDELDTMKIKCAPRQPTH